MHKSTRILLKCPHCAKETYHQFKNVFYVLPLSDQQKEDMKKLEEYEDKNGIERFYTY